MYKTYEEVEIPGMRLYLDFFIPTIFLAIEVQGEQHRKFIPHFHGTRQKFWDQLRRDINKADWLELNGIILIELNDGEDIDVWRKQFTNFRRKNTEN